MMTMKRIKIHAYKQGSKSARLLADTLGAKVLRLDGTSSYRPRVGDVVLNWGSSRVPDFGPALVLNPDVTTAQNKLSSFIKLQENQVSIPKFWSNPDEITAEDYPIVCRTLLSSHSGNGIVIADNPAGLCVAPLFTAYVKKKEEYRVHVFNGKVILIQRKAKKLGHDNPDYRVRNLSGGFAFVLVEAEEVPESVLEVAKGAVEALSLDFGGADVIWNEQQRRAYVLEVNSACGLEQRTADAYATAIRAIGD